MILNQIDYEAHDKESIVIHFVLEQNHDQKYNVKQNYTRHDKPPFTKLHKLIIT